MGRGGAGYPCSKLRPRRPLLVQGHLDPACLPTSAVLSTLCSFRNFDVEESHQCSLDWLMLGPAAPPRQEAFRLCGSAIPPAFISARDHVWIFFHSDASSSGQAQGFRLSYIRGDTSNRASQGTTEPQCTMWARAAPSTRPLPAGSSRNPISLSTVVGPGLAMMLPQGTLESKVTDPRGSPLNLSSPFTLRSGT